MGLGKLLGVGWFCFWFFITKIGENSGWFGYEIDSSCLDYYYAVVVGFGLVSTLVYACVVTKHSYSQQSLHNKFFFRIVTTNFNFKSFHGILSTASLLKSSIIRFD